MNFEIIPARKSDAPLIASAIMAAVGDEICLGLAGDASRIGLVHDTFTRLAEMEHSQYSYLNTLAAVTDSGEVAGLVISYDGADLHRLRRAFADVANEVLGMNIMADKMTDETSPDEIYLDTLCVFEPYRRRGLARRLIDATIARHASAGKPLGLLVDHDNPNARALYISAGFVPVGERPFAGVMMEHLQHND